MPTVGWRGTLRARNQSIHTQWMPKEVFFLRFRWNGLMEVSWSLMNSLPLTWHMLRQGILEFVISLIEIS